MLSLVTREIGNMCFGEKSLTRAAEKFCVCHRCTASSCDSEIGGKPGCVVWERLPKLGEGGYSGDKCVFLVIGRQ